VHLLLAFMLLLSGSKLHKRVWETRLAVKAFVFWIRPVVRYVWYFFVSACAKDWCTPLTSALLLGAGGVVVALSVLFY
jgi:hypothetical protein